jgi:hypothetical protein
MGTYYALNKRSGKQFALERFIRLFIPLVIGMLFIVPPQVYIERLSKNQLVVGDYFSYWPSQAFIGVYPEGNLSWHHLWFLPYLLLFSLVLIPVFLYLRKHPQNAFVNWIKKQVQHPLRIFWLIVPLYLTESLLEPFFPTTHALIGDWFTLVNYIIFFFYGFILIAVKDEFWKMVEEKRRIFLICGLIGFSLLLTIMLAFEDTIYVHFTEAFLKVFNLWSWILVLFGYASKYLNKRSEVLQYANEAVYPFYILHQTLIIIVGYYLMNLDIGFIAKFSIMILATFGGSWLLYEFGIRRWKALRPLFGLKVKPRKSY